MPCPEVRVVPPPRPAPLGRGLGALAFSVPWGSEWGRQEISHHLRPGEPSRQAGRQAWCGRERGSVGGRSQHLAPDCVAMGDGTGPVSPFPVPPPLPRAPWASGPADGWVPWLVGQRHWFPPHCGAEGGAGAVLTSNIQAAGPAPGGPKAAQQVLCAPCLWDRLCPGRQGCPALHRGLRSLGGGDHCTLVFCLPGNPLIPLVSESGEPRN